MKSLNTTKFVFLLTLFILSPIPMVRGQTPPSSLSYNPEQNFTIAFVNYDEALVDLTTIQLGLPTTMSNYLPYDINYELLHTDDAYESALNQFIDDSASEADWTSDLDSDALIDQKANFGRKSIFTTKNGTAIDALKVEQYLDDHPIESTLLDENHYTIYVFNLSRFDTNGNDHWFNLTEFDIDAGRSRSSWRLEWDYDLGNNYNVKFPYAAFSQNTDTAFIDLTAFQWYLEWRAIWNDLSNPHPSYYDDLDTLIKDLSPEQASDIIEDTAIEWLEDWITMIYNMNIDAEALGSSMSIQLNIMYRSSEIQLSNIDWIVNTEYTATTVNNLFRSDDFEVLATYIDLDQDQTMNDLFESHNLPYTTLNPSGTSEPFQDWKYYNGFGLYSSLYDQSISNTYYDESAADLVLKGSIYLVDNASYAGTTPWVGGLFTGLGGDLKLTILYELDRALFSNRESRKSGLSKVLVHEIGHAIGLPHTFSNRFTSDFISETMGYYPGSANYSEIISLQYQRTAVDNLFGQVTTLYQSQFSTLSDEYLLFASDSFDKAIELHKSKQFLEASHELEIALNTLNGQLPPSSSDRDNNGQSFVNFHLNILLWLILTPVLKNLKENKAKKI